MRVISKVAFEVNLTFFLILKLVCRLPLLSRDLLTFPQIFIKYLQGIRCSATCWIEWGNKAWILASTCLLPSRWQTRKPALWWVLLGCCQDHGLPDRTTVAVDTGQVRTSVTYPLSKRVPPSCKQAATANNCAFRQLSTEESRHTKCEQMVKAPLLYRSKHTHTNTHKGILEVRLPWFWRHAQYVLKQ